MGITDTQLGITGNQVHSLKFKVAQQGISGRQLEILVSYTAWNPGTQQLGIPGTQPGNSRCTAENSRYKEGNNMYTIWNSRYKPGNSRYITGNSRFAAGNSSLYTNVLFRQNCTFFYNFQAGTNLTMLLAKLKRCISINNLFPHSVRPFLSSLPHVSPTHMLIHI